MTAYDILGSKGNLLMRSELSGKRSATAMVSPGNASSFSSSNTTIAPFGIRATHPDEFIRELFGADQGAVLAAFREPRADYRNPPRTPGERGAREA